MASVHEGHRERVKKQFAEFGAESMTDIQLIELLLFFAVPRHDTNELAHALLERFGSFRGVMDAELQELEAVNGIGHHTALLIKTVRAALHRYAAGTRKETRYIFTSNDAGDYFVPILQFEPEEKAYVLCLGAKGEVISCRQISSGTHGSVNISIRQIVDEAVRRRCSKIVLAHNHPNGYAFPSVEDRMFTTELKRALQLMEIKLMDHIIVADSDYVSFAQSGYL